MTDGHEWVAPLEPIFPVIVYCRMTLNNKSTRNVQCFPFFGKNQQFIARCTITLISNCD